MALSDSALIVAKQLGRASADGTSIVDLEDEIKIELGNAIAHYNRQPWHLTELAGGELTTAQGVTWYSTVDLTSAGSDQSVTGRTAVDTNQIVKIHYMRENPGASGLNEPLSRVPYITFERLFEGSTPQGQPEYYTFYAGRIGIWPTPNAAHTLFFSGIVKPTVPTADGDTSVWFTEAWELIYARAAAQMCRKYIRDAERAAEFELIEAREALNLEGEHRRKTGTGRIRPHG